MKQKYMAFPFLLLLFFLLFYPQTAFLYSKNGLLLWFQTLLPALLPFMIVSNFLIATNLLTKWLSLPQALWSRLFGLTPNGAYALFLGLLCGYPMGAKVTADLYENQRITRNEAHYLLTFVNHPSPMFLSTYVILEILQRKELLIPSFFILYGSSYFCLNLARIYYKRSNLVVHMENKSQCIRKEITAASPMGEAIDTSIMNAFEGIIKLGGYMILFSIGSGCLKEILHTSNPFFYPLVGIVEITTGIFTLQAAPYSPSICYGAMMGILSSGGLCTLAQTKSMLRKTDLSIKPYLLGKLCAGSVSFLLSLIFIQGIKFI